MQTGNFLGIYLAKDHATVVCLAEQGRERKLVGCFSVSAEQSEQPGHQTLAQRISAVKCRSHLLCFSMRTPRTSLALAFSSTMTSAA